MVSTLGAGGSYCCEIFNGKLYVVVSPQDDFNRDFDRRWRGVSGNIALYAHETRHVDGFPHVGGCPVFPDPNSNACDQIYDESKLSPYGIQWWLHAKWLSGDLYVGYSCLSASEVDEIWQWHASATDGYRLRFVSNPPPQQTKPPQPGGPCATATPTPTPTPSPSPTPQWQPVVLTAQQILEIKAWTVGGRTYVYVKPQFPDAAIAWLIGDKQLET